MYRLRSALKEKQKKKTIAFSYEILTVDGLNLYKFNYFTYKDNFN